jgi:hypothetical protein
VREVVEEYGDAQTRNGKGDVAFVEVEFDAPENAELGGRYMVSYLFNWSFMPWSGRRLYGLADVFYVYHGLDLSYLSSIRFIRLFA